MTRILRDSIDPGVLRQFPAALVGGYDDGIFGPNHASFNEPGWDLPQWNTFPPGTVLVHIAAFASTDSGQVGDCETGDMTPQQAPGWVRLRRAAGQDPTIYHSFNGWGAVRDEFAAQGVPEPWWWIAAYGPGFPPQLFTHDDLGRATDRCVAHQYADPPITGHEYDESLVADYWPGVDMDPALAAQLKAFLDEFPIHAGQIAQAWNFLFYGGSGDVQGTPFTTTQLQAIKAAVQAPPAVDVSALAAALSTHALTATLSDAERDSIATHVLQHLAKDAAAG